METGEVVAVKSMRRVGKQSAQMTSIVHEVELLRNLNHPNIVRYLGSLLEPPEIYIILEYCENGSLLNTLKRFGRFPETLCIKYIHQILSGLEYLHNQGVIHRDIKSANILTTKEGILKLSDFGVASKSANSDDDVVGSPYWMAPEIIELSGISPAADIWSVGCTLIEFLTGSPPYFNLPPMSALFRIVQDDRPPIPESFSNKMRDFLAQCFQKDPTLRASAHSLLGHSWLQQKSQVKEVKGPTNGSVSSSGNNDLSRYVDDDETQYDDILGTEGNNQNFQDSFSLHFKTTHEDQQDDDDPFLQLDELETDDTAYAEILAAIEGLQSKGHNTEGFETLILVSEKSPQHTFEKLKEQNHLYPIMELLFSPESPQIKILAVKLLLNLSANEKALEYICKIGATSKILDFASDQSPQVQLLISHFVLRMIKTSEITRTMFLCCGGLVAAAALFKLAINRCDVEILSNLTSAMFTILSTADNIEKSDYSHQMTRLNIFPDLLRLHSIFSRHRSPSRYDENFNQIIQMFEIVSRCRVEVRIAFASHSLLSDLFRSMNRYTPVDQLTVLRSIKNFTTCGAFLDVLESVHDFLPTITEYLRMGVVGKYFKELRNQSLYILYNFCRVNRRRLELCIRSNVLADIIPLIRMNHPLKQFALPIVCDAAHISKSVQQILDQYDIFALYVELLNGGDEYWQLHALESLSVWLKDQSIHVESKYMDPFFVQSLMKAFTAHMHTRIRISFVQTLTEIMTLSMGFRRLICKESVFAQQLFNLLQSPSAHLQLGILKMVTLIVHDPECRHPFFQENTIASKLQNIPKNSVLVEEMLRTILIHPCSS